MDKVKKSLRQRYSHVFFLIFLRSIERSETDGELFDLLEDIPKNFPICWDEDEKRWKKTKLIPDIEWSDE